jgi:hypothetical protein
MTKTVIRAFDVLKNGNTANGSPDLGQKSSKDFWHSFASPNGDSLGQAVPQ